MKVLAISGTGFIGSQGITGNIYKKKKLGVLYGFLSGKRFIFKMELFFKIVGFNG